MQLYLLLEYYLVARITYHSTWAACSQAMVLMAEDITRNIPVTHEGCKKSMCSNKDSSTWIRVIQESMYFLINTSGKKNTKSCMCNDYIMKLDLLQKPIICYKGLLR